MQRTLEKKVAVVAGATRGAGRGIAVELGAAGATVYCTGRSVRGKTTGRPETIDETAELVTRAGGQGIAIPVDHTQPEQVAAVFQRIASEQDAQLDIVVNDIWGGDELAEWGVPFWEHSLANGLTMLERAINTHIITSHYAAPLLVGRKQGVIFEITDGKTYEYRGAFFYDLVKVTVMRMALTMAKDLEPYRVAAIAVTPGFLRSEAMLDHFGVTEENWRAGAKQDRFFAFSETPHYIGRAIVALASDPNIMDKTGQTLATWDLAEEYGITDLDGTRPHWQRNYEAEIAKSGR
ncbi:MAG: SDR family NAD(P)-dependent oxidoreductase [Chloroflexi bacterium]|nr:SDR family NAD(P)-dependent oxidoreductase [Chloroflexota bacterium]